MSSRVRIILSAALIALYAPYACAASPVATQLTAETMDYNMETGDFKASGNVTLRREGLTLVSVYGVANTKTQKARMWNQVHAYGIHNGENLNATCAQLDADFSVSGGDYLMSGNVDATFGSRVLRSDTARLTGRVFVAENVKHFEDKARNFVLTCTTISGDYDDEGLRVADGTGPVVVTQDDKDKNSKLWCDSFAYRREEDRLTGNGNARILVTEKADTRKKTEIRSDMLVYVFSAGAVTASGNARAVQEGRRVAARNLIYYPETGKLEARGKPSITVDVVAPGGPTSRRRSAQNVVPPPVNNGGTAPVRGVLPKGGK